MYVKGPKISVLVFPFLFYSPAGNTSSTSITCCVDGSDSYQKCFEKASHCLLCSADILAAVTEGTSIMPRQSGN